MGGALGGLSFGMLSAGYQAHQDKNEMTRAGEVFKRQCASCHVPPDLRFRADQAWLRQIKQTA